MEQPEELPEFYTGSPVEARELRFRSEFLEDLWETLETRHVLLTAPRRTGKTSVMDHLKAYPQTGFQVVSVNVQDLAHPADVFQTILDAFHDAHPDYFRDMLASGWGWLKRAVGKVDDVEFAGLKLALREEDPDWRKNWRKHGDRFLQEVRKHERRTLLVIDELPDMLLNLARTDETTLTEFLAWWRTQRQNPHPKQDPVRWLIGGSVNLKSTLDSLSQVDLINDLEDLPLPVLTDAQVHEFVREMLAGRGVTMTDEVPARVVERLGRPIPLFMQMATQDLYRLWKRELRAAAGDSPRPLERAHVDEVFHELIVSSAAQDKLQHYYSRIARYYDEPRLAAAYELLGKLSVSDGGLSRQTLLAEFERVLGDTREELPQHERKRHFHQLMRDLENDFYIAEIGENYDFSSGVLKAWWRKYYA